FSERAKWRSRTNNKGAWRLYMQGDCNLVLYSFNFSTAVWQSNTRRSSCY
ncbi:MAG: curculin (mannose-binding) lectin, partial [Deltaproteobacteria bacterium]|nr:curculin (mannose-binding) lectin [Deltaproteobacteria bacterium]